jgi:hypothetical protein
MMFCARADEYSGWKLNGVPEQSAGLVFMNPLAAEAIMKPLCPVVRSVSLASRRVGALEDALDRMLDRAQAVAVQPADLVRADTGARCVRGLGSRHAQSRYQRRDHEEHRQNGQPPASPGHSHTRPPLLRSSLTSFAHTAPFLHKSAPPSRI